MMIDKRKFLFRYVPQALRNILMMDEEAMYSTTDQVTGRKLCDELNKYVPSESTVVDATACIGGLTHSLTHVFRKVIAIEIDTVKFDYLKTNVSTLGIDDSVECIKGDALDICRNMNASAIILDPPWGGPEYKKIDSVSLSLSGVDIADVCCRMFELNPLVNIIGLKVPVNFAEELFAQRIGPHKIVHKAKLRKMWLLIIQAERKTM